MNRETHLLHGKLKQDCVSHTSPGRNAATGTQPTPPATAQAGATPWPWREMTCASYAWSNLSLSHSLGPLPQKDPSSTPTNSEVSHYFPQVLQRPTFPFQTHLTQDELNFLDPPPQNRAKDSPVSNTKLASPQAFYKGVVFAAHLLWTIIPTFWHKHTANSLLVTGYKKFH